MRVIEALLSLPFIALAAMRWRHSRELVEASRERPTDVVSTRLAGAARMRVLFYVIFAATMAQKGLLGRHPVVTLTLISFAAIAFVAEITLTGAAYRARRADPAR